MEKKHQEWIIASVIGFVFGLAFCKHFKFNKENMSGFDGKYIDLSGQEAPYSLAEGKHINVHQRPEVHVNTSLKHANDDVNDSQLNQYSGVDGKRKKLKTRSEIKKAKNKGMIEIAAFNMGNSLDILQ